MSWADDIDADIPAGVYYAGELVFAGASETDTTGRKVVFDLPTSKDVNPFARATLKRGKRAGTIFKMTTTWLANHAVVETREVMLLGWHSGPRGHSVTFLVDADYSFPYLACRRAKGDDDGDRWMAVFVEVNDDSSVTAVEKPRSDPAGKPRNGGQKLSNQAVLLCKNPEFQAWLANRMSSHYPSEESVDEASTTALLKTVCGVISRAEIDSNPASAATFTGLRAAFNSRS